MKTLDEKLQESIERGDLNLTDLDSRAYKIVFGALKKDPDTALKTQFADSVIKKIMSVKERHAVRMDYLWLSAGVFVLFVTAIITIILTNFRPALGAFQFIVNYGGLLIVAGFLIGFFQWIDKKVLVHKSVI